MPAVRTPPRAPVDERYQLRPRTRAFLRERMRLHGFDLLAPIPFASLRGLTWRREHGPHGTERFWLGLRHPRLIPPGAALSLPPLPIEAGGLVGARVDADGPARTLVQGEPLAGATPRSWRLKPPLLGSPTVRAGRRAVRLRGVELWSSRPGPLDDLDRYPIHLPVRVGEELELPLVPWRSGRLVEQIAIHWGSVAYRHPEHRLPLGAWGYPYYLDGVLGDVFAHHAGRWRPLAKGKFLEFDEVENIRGFKPQRMDRVRVRLRRRDDFEPTKDCRIAAVEVRYALEPGREPPLCIELDRRVTPRRPFTLRLPDGVQAARIDLRWRDRGPAMGALQIGAARSPWANVCSGEQRCFCNFLGLRPSVVEVRAELAPLTIEQALVYGRMQR